MVFVILKVAHSVHSTIRKVVKLLLNSQTSSMSVATSPSTSIGALSVDTFFCFPMRLKRPLVFSSRKVPTISWPAAFIIPKTKSFFENDFLQKYVPK